MTGAEMFLAAAILISLCVVAGWAAGARRERRSVEPPPASWWVCPSCRSVNAGLGDDESLTCYHCGRVADPATVERMETSPEFEMRQQLATTRKGGWDQAVGWAADQADRAEAPIQPAEDPIQPADDPTADEPGRPDPDLG